MSRFWDMGMHELEPERSAENTLSIGASSRSHSSIAGWYRNVRLGFKKSTDEAFWMCRRQTGDSAFFVFVSIGSEVCRGAELW